MNTEDMEKLYKKIGSQLDSIIPESWDKVLLYSAVTEWSNRTYFYYYSHGAKNPYLQFGH